MSMTQARAHELHEAAWEAMRTGDMARAILLAGQSAALYPHPDYLMVLGHFQLGAGHVAAAIATLRAAVAADPQSPDIQGSLAMALRQTGDPRNWREAVVRLEIAVALAPDRIAAQLNLAVLRHHAAQGDGAVLAEIDRAHHLEPLDPDVPADAAAILYDRGRFGDALAASRRALCLDPVMVRAVHGHAETVAVLRQADAAIGWFDRLLALDPAAPVYRVARAKARLAAGDARGGWDDYEARRGLPVFGLPAAMADDSAPQSLSDKTVVVYPEQGFGDVIQFISFIPALCARAARIFLVAAPELKALLEELPAFDGRLRVIDADAARQVSADLALPVMSLPRLLDLAPDGTAYLAASARQRDRWAQALAGYGGLRVGVCWSGNPRPGAPTVMRMTDYRRSIPLEAFGPLLQGIEGATFISLQHGYRDGETPSTYGIRDASAYLRDFSDLAGLIVNLDLVISVDTAVAHLAGALGVPTWMLNRFDSCWRWERGSGITRWYRSMRIFSQVAPMRWAEPLAEMAAALRALIADQAAAMAARNTSP